MIQPIDRAPSVIPVSEDCLRALVEKNADGMVIVDGDGVLEFANPAAADLFGRDAAHLLGCPFGFPLVTGETTEIELRRPDGTMVTVEMRVVETTWEDRPALLASLRDVTHRKQAEDEILRLNRELEERVRARTSELLEKATQLEAASQAKNHFLAVLSHELRTPLTPVLLVAAAMEHDPSMPPEVRAHFELVRRNVELETKLIDDLLDLTRIEQGRVELRPEAVDVHALLDDAIRSYCQPDTQRKQLRLTTDLAASNHHVWADAARLAQVLWNLLKNAVKFTPNGGEIHIHTSNRPDGRLEVAVADTGIGIEPHAQQRIFAAFEQQDRTITRQFGGLGLGLSIARRLVDMHGGEIRVASDGKGKGATFAVTLPVVDPPPSAPGTVDTRAGAGAALRILLVEDHAETLQVMVRLLRSDGHHVTTAGDITTAKQLARANRFDLIVSDVGLPDGSGAELMHCLRQQHGLKGIAISGFGTDEDLRQTREAGFSEHLVKPIRFAKLQAAIARVSLGNRAPA